MYEIRVVEMGDVVFWAHICTSKLHPSSGKFLARTRQHLCYSFSGQSSGSWPFSQIEMSVLILADSKMN